MKIRVIFFIILLVSIFILLLTKVYYISIKSNEYYEKLALENIIKTEKIAPIRGIIRDRNGIPLAVNELGFSISLPPHLSTKSKLTTLTQKIKIITDLFPEFDPKKLKKIYLRKDSYYNHNNIQIIDYILYDQMISKFVKLSMHKDIFISPASKRFYPYANTASHLLGYVSKANTKDMDSNEIAKYTKVIGKGGIERYYNSVLSGEFGLKKTKVTALNKEIGIISKIYPTSDDINLSIDIRLQLYIKKLFKDKNGAVIVMDAKDGSILAAGSYPEYDPNIFVRGMSQNEWEELINNLYHPLTNKFAKGLYPPGSVTKPAISLSFLDSKLLTKHTHQSCSGDFELGGRNFRCWKQHGHGDVSFKRSIQVSCDIYYYKAGLKVGIDKVSSDLKRYGLGKKTDIDLPSEFIGTVPNKEWKMKKFNQPWYKGETLNTMIGQGDFLVTPLQIAQLTALLATSKQVTPHFAKAIGQRVINYSALDVLNNFEKSKLKIIQKAMYDVCNKPGGTAYHHIKSKVKIAGKTGTAQVIGIPQKEKVRMSEQDLQYFHRSHAWLSTFGPFKNPQFVVTVLVEHGGHGGSAAGSIVSKIYDKLLKFGYIK